MIIIISMVIGYILGVLPIIYSQIIKFEGNKIRENNKENESHKDLTPDIIDEWVNGKKEDNKKALTPNDILNEYMTGDEE
ncbi:MAG: hypothetical protein RR290_00670 [Clostridia bacterium]